MKTVLTLFLLTILLSACKSYVQVFNTKSSVQVVDEGTYVYENDSLKITYSFWEENGLMTFSIYNKLDKPIYIDWKKSSYIDNSVKLNYWKDEEQSTTLSLYETYTYNGPVLKPGYIIGTSQTSTIKEERITFIPPQSYYYRSQFYLFPIDFFELDTQTDFKEVPRNDNRNKYTKLYKASFLKENSPLVFRNFITFSLTEDFNSEFYVDNEFYIYEILEMDQRHFEKYKLDESKKGKWYVRDEEDNPIKVSSFHKYSSFYIRVPEGSGIQDRD